MRYFFISYAHDKGFGNIDLSVEEFPSYNSIFLTVKESNPEIENVTVLSIFEFKNEQDFNDWVGNELDNS